MAIRRWGRGWRNSKVICESDNTQVVWAVNTGRSINELSMSILREIFWYCVIYNCHVVATHVSGVSNVIPDFLSRITLLAFLKGLLRKAGLDDSRVGLHSLRRVGAVFMHSMCLSLEDIRQAGDWSSLAALIYLAKPMPSKIRVDQRVAASLSRFI